MKKKPILCFFIGYVPDFTKESNFEFYGSEIALMNLSKYFKEKYDIVVFGDLIENEKIIDNIKFLNNEKYENFIKDNEIEIIIISRYIYHFLEFELVAKKIFIWVHDVYVLPYYQSTRIPYESKYFLKNIIDKIDGIITLSDWHRNYFIDFYEIDPSKVFKIGNGINVEDFKDNNIDKIKNRFIWTSHSFRGLDKLIEYFHDIKKEIPDAELYIYRDKNSVKDLLDEIEKYDYIHYGGKLDNKDVIKEFQKSDIWFYPTDFDEGYCISALEAQMSGCVCITSDKAALKETVNNRGILIKENIYSEEYKEKSINEVIRILNDDELKNEYKKLGKEWAKEQTWKKRSEEWYELFNK